MASPGFNPNSPFAKAIKQNGMDAQDVPADKYDEFRANYFNARIAPRLTPAEREKQREVFMQRTKRPDMGIKNYVSALATKFTGTVLGSLDKTAAGVMDLSSVAARSSFTPGSPSTFQQNPLSQALKAGGSMMRERGENLEEAANKASNALAYHGHGGILSPSGVAGGAGTLTAYGLEMAAGEKAISPIAKAIPKIGEGIDLATKAFPKLAPAAGRSVAFGALSALEAEPGKHTSAFTVGTAWGVFGELTGAALGGLWKYFKGKKGLPSPGEIDDYVKGMAREEVPAVPLAQDVDHAIAGDVIQSHKEVGYLANVKAVLDEKQSNPIAVFTDQAGHPLPPSKLSSADPEKAYATLKNAVEGGEITLSEIRHDEMDAPFVHNLLAKLKQNYEPWSLTPTQIATDVIAKGLDVGGGTARVDGKVLKFNYARQMPSNAEAKHFIKFSLGIGDEEVPSASIAEVDKYMQLFEKVWAPFGNHIDRAEAAAKLEQAGLTDLIPSAAERARWKPSEGMNLPKVFNTKGWFTALDNWKGMTEQTHEIRMLEPREKDYLTSAAKTLWDPAVPSTSTMFKSALRALAQKDLLNFIPGSLNREEVASLLNETRAGTETQAKAMSLVDKARLEAPLTHVKEHLYQQISRVAETFAKNKDVDEKALTSQYGKQTVDAGKQMAGLMWERAKGDPLAAKWDEELLKQGIDEGILPGVDPSGKPLTQWFGSGEEHIASTFGIDDIASLTKSARESLVLRLAEQYNVEPGNIDAELAERVGEAGIAQAHEIAAAARKANVSVYNRSVMEEAARLGKFSDEDAAFAPRDVPPSEVPSKLPGEPTGLPARTVRLPDGSAGSFAYSIKRATSGLPSRLYVMFDDSVAKQLEFGGKHSRSAAYAIEEFAKHPVLSSVISDIKALADISGVELSKLPITLVHRPNEGFTKALSAPLVWHEDLHGALTQIGLNLIKKLKATGSVIGDVLWDTSKKLPSDLQKTLGDITKSINSQYPSLYKGEGPEEGFVHAATAIRFGDTGKISRLAADDTSVEHIYNTVQAVATALREKAALMPPGSAKNVIMDRLGLIESFSNVDRFKAHREVAEQMFADLGENSSTIVTKQGSSTFRSLKDMIGEAEGSLEGRLFAPNYTAVAEAAGVRQALYPSQLPPGRTIPPTPEIGIDESWNFAKAAPLWEKIAPTFSFINSIDKYLNDKFSVKGAYLPLADTAKGVDEAYRAGSAWLESNRDSALSFLTVGKKKLETYGEMLTHPPKDWKAYIQKYELTNDDLVHLKAAHEWVTKFGDDTGVRLLNYLQEQYPKLARSGFDLKRVYQDPAKGSSMATFQRLITTGELNPRDLHLGRLINVALREGMEAKFTGDALKEFKKVVDLKTKDGAYVLGDLRPTLLRYHDYMKGIPDNSGKLINNFAKGVVGGLNSGIERINQTLPKGFQVPAIDYQGNVLSKLILMNYIANLGLRPAIAARDSLQGVALSMPIIGPKTFFKGFGLAFTDAHWKLAEDSGALLKGKNVEDVFGDIFQEIQPGKFDKALSVGSQLLAPSRWGHNIARRTVFAGVYDNTLPALATFRKSYAEKFTPLLADELDHAVRIKMEQVGGRELTREELNFARGIAAQRAALRVNLDKSVTQAFLDDTGLWFADKVRQKQLINLALDRYVPKEEVAKQAALEMLDLTLWPYRRGTNPGLLKTGFGRVFGQYGLWPMSYLDYIRRLSTKVSSNPKKALPALGLFAVVNYELVAQARKHLGVDVSKWFGVSPGGFAGSPHLQFMLDLGRSLEESNEGREARKRVAEYPLQFVPASNEMRSLKESWGKPMLDDDGWPTADAWKALGFKAYKPGDPTLEQVFKGDINPERWVDFETGGVTKAARQTFQEGTNKAKEFFK